jgi:hypothetical protein
MADPKMSTMLRRGFLAPVAEYEDGSTSLAVPGILYEPYQAFNRLMQNAYDINADPETKRQAIEDSFVVSGAAMTGGGAASALRRPFPVITEDAIALYGPASEARDLAMARRLHDYDAARFRGGDILHPTEGAVRNMDLWAPGMRDYLGGNISARNLSPDVAAPVAANDARIGVVNSLYANGGKSGAATGAGINALAAQEGKPSMSKVLRRGDIF